MRKLVAGLLVATLGATAQAAPAPQAPAPGRAGSFQVSREEVLRELFVADVVEGRFEWPEAVYARLCARRGFWGHEPPRRGAAYDAVTCIDPVEPLEAETD